MARTFVAQARPDLGARAAAAPALRGGDNGGCAQASPRVEAERSFVMVGTTRGLVEVILAETKAGRADRLGRHVN